MQSARVRKSKPRSSKPPRNESARLCLVADSITTPDNEAMVSCTECVRGGVTCYYDRAQSIKCAECLRRRKDCDGTFSLEEFRRVGEQKKQMEAKAREKRRQVIRLRGALKESRQAMEEARQAMLKVETTVLAAESEEADLQDGLSELEATSSRMLEREMRALGVLNSLPPEAEVALADPDLAWSDVVFPAVGPLDWNVIPGFADDNLQSSLK